MPWTPFGCEQNGAAHLVRSGHLPKFASVLEMITSHCLPLTSMKKLVVFSVLLAATLSGCSTFFGGKDGELTGAEDRPTWDSPEPYGMVLVPAGSFHMGQNDQDVNYSQIARTRQISISAFWMDDTEVTNNEWRQFVEVSVDPTSKTTTGNELAFEDSVRNFLLTTYNKSYPGPAYAQLIVPDTSRWVKDFGSYTYNEPIVENYYSHPAFDDYPVVGVDWYAGQAFAHWRTRYYNYYRRQDGKADLPRFRLPSEAEWEYAARGGLEHKLYPWEGLALRNHRGCFLANFKNQRGDYIGDNYSYTSPVRAYWPNDFGLFDMSGNVSEWCEDDFEESAYTYTLDLNPVYRSKNNCNTSGRFDPSSNQRTKTEPGCPKVVRGGSWKDIGYFLAVGTRDFEYAENTKSFIGLRCVSSVIGPQGASQGY